MSRGKQNTRKLPKSTSAVKKVNNASSTTTVVGNTIACVPKDELSSLSVATKKQQQKDRDNNKDLCEAVNNVHVGAADTVCE